VTAPAAAGLQGVEIGSVLALAARPHAGAAPLAQRTLLLEAGHGIVGDPHADPRSPRQLLLASGSTYHTLQLAPHTLRENLLLDCETARLASGTVLALGPTVRLRLMFQCEACGQLDLARPGLARQLGLQRGMLARVLSGGVISHGDRVLDLGRPAPAWSDDWHARVRRVLDAVPPGHVLAYRQLARLAGLQATYCRAFPRLLAKFGAPYPRLAVPAHASCPLPRWDGNGLFEHD
jgi:MOSC domain-containing protein YiiM